jgi:hypothetical protein
MTIADTYSKLVSMVAATTSIALCPEELVDAIPEDGLPFGQVIVGQGVWNEHAIGLFRQERTYTINVYVQPVAEGIGPDEGYKKCLTPLYDVGRMLVQNRTFDGLIDNMGSGGNDEFTDSGVRVLSYAGRDYHGFTITLVTVEKAA